MVTYVTVYLPSYFEGALSHEQSGERTSPALEKHTLVLIPVDLAPPAAVTV